MLIILHNLCTLLTVLSLSPQADEDEEDEEEEFGGGQTGTVMTRGKYV